LSRRPLETGLAAACAEHQAAPVASRGREERDRLAATFESAADLYHRARSDYPEELYDHLVRVTALRPGARVLEVGCATGKATLPLARRGYRLTCVEPGTDLAAAARRNLGAFDATVVESRFEDWRPGPERYRLVFAATAWHWVDPEVRYRRAADALEEGGHLALWGATHVSPRGGDPIFEEIQEVYEEIGDGLPPDAVWPRPYELPPEFIDIEDGGLFEVVDLRQFAWQVDYDADSWIDLLNTFSGHIAMEDWQRDRLYGEFRRRLAARPSGTLRRGYGVTLQIARRV
jgi:SAM-dependent methyltransferase